MRVLPIPPIVGQNTALNPDGSVEPDHAYDCGEACWASAFDGYWGIHTSPGCVRQMLGEPASGSGTSAAELGGLWRRFHANAVETVYPSADLWAPLAKLRRFGRYALLLGNWISPTEGHWVLAYERGTTTVMVMGPWDGAYFAYTRARVEAQSLGSQLWVS